MSAPNIIFIMTDQQRADMVKSEGFPVDTMPFHDSWSGEGARFRRAYTSSPLCVPARLSLFTGRFPKAHRVRDNYRGGKDLYKPAPDLVDLLRERGYATALIGKNHSHLGCDSIDLFETYGHHGYMGARPIPPEHERFDRWLKSRGNRISREATPFSRECQQPVRIVSEAIAYLSTQPNDPFFLWLSFPEPHNPSQVSEPYFSLFDPVTIPAPATGYEDALNKGGKWRWMAESQKIWNPRIQEDGPMFRRAYCGMLRLIDEQIERLVVHLKHIGIYDNTFIVFVSDHGDYALEYGLHGKGVGMPECLVRIPFLITGPGILPSDDREAFVSITDIYPTICDALGIDIPLGIQGRSLWPVLTRSDRPGREFESVYAESGVGNLHLDLEAPGAQPLSFRLPGKSFDGLNNVSMSGKTKMVRMDRWKIISDMIGETELYDLDTDPMELTNLSGVPAFRDAEHAMTKELLKWTIRTEDDMPRGLYERYRLPHNWYNAI